MPGTALITVAWVLTLLVYAGGAVYAQDHAPIPMDTADVEDELESWFADQDVQGTVDCPAEAAPQVGESFQCTLDGQGGEFFIVDVTVTDIDGSIVWEARQ